MSNATLNLEEVSRQLLTEMNGEADPVIRAELEKAQAAIEASLQAITERKTLLSRSTPEVLGSAIGTLIGGLITAIYFGDTAKK